MCGCGQPKAALQIVKRSSNYLIRMKLTEELRFVMETSTYGKGLREQDPIKQKVCSAKSSNSSSHNIYCMRHYAPDIIPSAHGGFTHFICMIQSMVVRALLPSERRTSP